MAASVQPLARAPLAQLVPELLRRLEKMTPDRIVAILGMLDAETRAPGSSDVRARAPATSAAPSASSVRGSLEAIAKMTVDLPTGEKLREVERSVLAHALATTRGNVSAAARLLGVDRKALERKLSRHRLR
jgi:DNA-binding NtrC family response regulator